MPSAAGPGMILTAALASPGVISAQTKAVKGAIRCA